MRFFSSALARRNGAALRAQHRYASHWGNVVERDFGQQRTAAPSCDRLHAYNNHTGES